MPWRNLGKTELLEHLTAEELGRIALRGGSLEINGAQFTSEELGVIALRLSAGATMRIHNCQRFTADELGTIALRGSGKVIFC